MSGEITWGCLAQPALFRGSQGNTKTQPARVSLLLGDALTRFLALPRASVHKPDWSILSIRYGMSWGLGWGLGNKQKWVGGSREVTVNPMGTPAQMSGRGWSPAGGWAFQEEPPTSVHKLLLAKFENFQLISICSISWLPAVVQSHCSSSLEGDKTHG